MNVVMSHDIFFLGICSLKFTGRDRMVKSYGTLSEGDEERTSRGFDRSADALDFSFVSWWW